LALAEQCLVCSHVVQVKVPHVVNKEWIRDFIRRRVAFTLDVNSVREWTAAPPASMPSPVPSPIPLAELSKDMALEKRSA